ncbi:hypothetical protein CBR_g31803 [Chara braunii]|uniref:Uncharacterized protein n=1 Tax=Chara braunii TaxID=69332 RepID=A0A388LFU1_CHABU|nr:hypothetical protein CBR_g31803 [Chara braunii]|eukprot:GBG81127.1 hypothetical protein CBR_g31803 [Chara braunii]
MLPSSELCEDLITRKLKSRTKRIDISSDEEGAAGVKQNLHAKMEGSSELMDIKLMLASLLNGIGDIKGKGKVVLSEVKSEPEPVETPAVETGNSEEAKEAEDVDVEQNKDCTEDEEEIDEGGLAAYMKIRREFYNSLHYTRLMELCKQKSIRYFKEMGAWELARLDLQNYADQLNADPSAVVAEHSKKNEAWSEDGENAASGSNDVKGN